jgi:NAD+ diphosphatase
MREDQLDAAAAGMLGGGTGEWDRAAHRRIDKAWLDDAWARAQVLMIATDGRAIVQNGRLILVPSAGILGDRLFLGVDDAGIPYFAVAGEPDAVDGGALVHLWEVGVDLSARDARLFASGLGLMQWHRDHQFSPATGMPTLSEQGGWVRREANGELHFPRTDPAVIMLVHDGQPGPQGRALLGSGALWAPVQGIRRYSTLAGFVEPGETAEAAVAREVFEEAGVRVRQISYFGSQPHPYPRSLMLGFTALADPADPIRPDPEELADARWFSRDEVRPIADGSAGDFRLPNRSSISFRLVMHWLRVLA